MSERQEPTAFDRLMSGPAGKWINAREEAKLRDINFEGLLFEGTDNYCRPIEGAPILPGRDAESIGYDLSDWDGISLEFCGYVGDPPTEEEQQRIWDMGFTVIRIDFKDPAVRQDSIDGDWWRVQGYEPGHCSCHKPECGCREKIWR